MKQFWKGLGLAAMVAALALVSVVPVVAQEDGSPPYTLSVTGHGSAHGTPNIAYLHLGVNLTGDDVGDVVANVNERMEEVRQALVDVGVGREDMQTSNFNLWSDDRFDEKGAPTGERLYRAENMLRIMVRDVALVDEVIEAGLDAGATNLFGLSFGLEDSSELEQEARLAAIADAQDRAEKIAAALGMTVSEPISVNESLGGAGPVFEAARAGGMGGGPVIEEGQFTVNMSIHITFKMEKKE